MEIIRADDPSAALRAAQILAQGGVILYPTDTLYGLGADALSDDAVAKIHQIKGSDPEKPMHCVVTDIAMASQYGEINELAETLAAKYLPGPLTLILRKRSGIDTGIGRGMDTIGIRVPDNAICLRLAREFDRPFTTTSANAHGEKPETTVTAILAQLGDKAQFIDLVIDAGALPERAPSTIVDVSTGALAIIREGALAIRDILA